MTLAQAERAYRRYMMKTWNGHDQTATQIAHQVENKQSRTREIQEQIKLGGLQNRFKNILNLYLTCRIFIKQNLDLRPPGKHKTHCLYIHGLQKTNQCYPQIDYYMKSYGFTSEYWDGYNNEVCVVVDDPARPGQYKINAVSECWKNILSGSQFLANQKYGGIQFDSHFCIILSNISARDLAESFPHDEVDAHYR